MRAAAPIDADSGKLERSSTALDEPREALQARQIRAAGSVASPAVLYLRPRLHR
jgi:hypothetical protein